MSDTHHFRKCRGLPGSKAQKPLFLGEECKMIHFSCAIIVFGDNEPNAPNAMIARLKERSGPPNPVVVKGKNRGQTPKAIVA